MGRMVAPWVHVEVMGSVQALLGTGGDVVVARGRSGAVGEAVGDAVEILERVVCVVDAR